MIEIREEPLELQELVDSLSHNSKTGAVVTFIGLVRDFNQNKSVESITLEHYPSMTRKILKDLEKEAKQRWRLNRIQITHCVGTLSVNDPIVFVGVASRHRGDAFQACEFLIDMLKAHVPFWKCEHNDMGDTWVKLNPADEVKAKKWRQEALACS